MTWFAVFEVATGRLESVGQVVADDATLAAKGLDKLALPGKPDRTQQWNEGTRTYDTITPPKRKIEMQQFIDRFTPSEWDDLTDLATTNKQARGFVNYLRTAKSVDPNNPRFQTALDGMVTAGILAAGRPAEILVEG